MTFRLMEMLLCILLLAAAAEVGAEIDYSEQRRQMITAIEADVRETSYYIDQKALDKQVMKAMSRVPRHAFVPAKERNNAYENRPLPIGHGQTISQPYIVALMTDLLRVDSGDLVLEVGTGSGYQAAILAEIAEKVFTIEIVRPLGKAAADRLNNLGYTNIETRIGDGYYGWPELAAFDAIVVTAASSHIPPPLLKQLNPGGRMVIPVGGRFQVQQLMLIEKSTTGEITNRQMLPVRFVPLTGGH